MDENKLLKFSVVEKLLSKYGFHGFNLKRDGHKLTHTYISIRYYAVTITVTVLKIKDKKYVVSVNVNGEDIEDFKSLMNTLNDMGKIHKKEANKLVKVIK